GPARPWLRAVRSLADGVRGAPRPADLEDRRLGQAAAWRLAGGRLRDHALARRPELPLGQGLDVYERRRSSEFTDVDGNVAAVAATAGSLRKVFEEGRPIAATPVEQWARCPFKYFLGRVLGVEATKR